MNVNRALLFWGLALITAGAIALAVQQGLIDRGLLGGLWRLWPLILIAIGLSIVLSRTPFAVVGTALAALLLGVAGGALVTLGPGVACSGDVATDLQAEQGAFAAESASVNLDFNCGDLEVAMMDGSDWQAGTAVAGDREVELSADSDSLSVSTSDEGWGWNEGRQRWEIGLGSEVAYDLGVSLNAGEATLDLGGGTFDSLSVTPNAGSLTFDLAGSSIGAFRLSMNAGSADILTDAGTALAGTVSMNAGSLELCTPPDAAVRLRVGDNVAFSHNLEESDLTRSGDTWTSDGFEGAERTIDLRVEGNAASFALNPEGGC